MLTCFLQGGLGNQLFQIFATIAHSERCGTSFYFKNAIFSGDIENGSTIRHTYWTTFFANLKPFLKSEYVMPYTIIKEPAFTFQPPIMITSANGPHMLVGYYQSPKYFEKIKHRLFKLIQLDLHKQNLSNELKLDFQNTISIHFRIGDYIKYPTTYPILTQDYYIKSIKTILEKTGQLTTTNLYKIYYFCEINDIPVVLPTIHFLQFNFPNMLIELMNPELSDWKQMVAMSMCSYNVIANSTFSWWSAYFNTNSNKIVCYPEKWFNNNIDTRDLFPLNENWFKIYC